MRKAFTLIELLIFIAIFSMVVVAFISILVVMLRLETSQTASTEVNQQGQFLVQQIQYYVSSARFVDMTQDVATTTLVLRENSFSTNPTEITFSSGNLYLQQGNLGSLQALNSSRVTISNVSFTRHYNISTTSVAFGSDSVSYAFTVSATSTNNQLYSQTFQSSVAVLAPVPKIVLLQQAKGESNTASVSTVGATYPTANESSSLLLALVTNTTTTASITVTDSASNTWTQVASIAYPAYNKNMALFAAVNAKNSANTVTATFGSGAGYASLYIYEYRGASTSSSFDASSSQIQSNTTTPSSGNANATSAVELLFGANYNAATTETPSAGIGFTLETYSTVAYVATEDMDEYVTGPVSAPWQYIGSTSSSALIATFK
jgi:competence protein ComGC